MVLCLPCVLSFITVLTVFLNVSTARLFLQHLFSILIYWSLLTGKIVGGVQNTSKVNNLGNLFNDLLRKTRLVRGRLDMFLAIQGETLCPLLVDSKFKPPLLPSKLLIRLFQILDPT